MPKPDRLAGLREEELSFYIYVQRNTGPFWQNNVLPAYKRLATCREEIKNLESNLEDYKYFVKQRNERIARMRALLKKHQYRNSGDEFDNDMYCVGCFASIHVPPGTSQSNIKLYTDKIVCTPDCALAAELERGE